MSKTKEKSSREKKAKAKPAAAKAASLPDVKALVASLKGVVGDGNAQLLGGGGLSIKIKGVIPTRCATIDAAIGRGGVPRSRLTILHGAEGCGKTTLALQIVAEAQQMGGAAVFLDKEYKLDLEYAANLGCDLERLVYATPETLETCFETIEATINHFKEIAKEREEKMPPIVVVLDSMNAALTKVQMEADWDATDAYGPQARAFSQKLPKLLPLVHRSNVTLLFISQLRKKIGVTFGDDAGIAGGNAPMHHASLILFIKRLAGVKDDEGDKKANITSVYVKKNQIAPPFKTARCIIVYGKGIDAEDALIRQGLEMKVVELSGSHYSAFGKRLAQGADKAAEFLRSEKGRDLRAQLDLVIKEELNW